MSKRCGENSCNLGAAIKFRRCDDDGLCTFEQRCNTETLQGLIRTMEDLNRQQSTTDTLLDLLNIVRSMAEVQTEPLPNSLLDIGSNSLLDSDSNSQQVGCGSDSQSFNPSEPNFGLSEAAIESIVREGGSVGDYTVVPRRRFNGLEIRRRINMRVITAPDLAAYAIFLHDIMSEIVSFSRLLAGDGGLINITLRGPSLPSDVNAVLSPDNDYDLHIFTQQLENIMQSNSDVRADECLDLYVSIARGKHGGAYRKIRDLAHNEVIARNRMNLFCPNNISNNLCFAICLSHFLQPHTPCSELESLAASLQKTAGYSVQQKIGFNDITRFERLLHVKIVVFHRTCSGLLEHFTNNDEPHNKTVFLYLHNEHYFLIKNLKAFIGTPYVCEYCYRGFTSRRDHRCKYVCDVCNAPDCHKYAGKTRQCHDCLRYCRSTYCYNAHKQTQTGQQYAQCDVTKYCQKCNRRYHVNGAVPKKHVCPAEHCIHCKAELVNDGVHQCFIQPIKMEPPSDKYIYYDFETQHTDGKHVANFVCAITFKGEEFTAAGTDCIDQLVEKFRQPHYQNYTWVAHNASGFDNFILLEYFAKAGLTLQITMQGCRIILMYDKTFKQRFIDSYSFIPMRLSMTSAALNLTCAEKGHFPHLFNRTENEDYVGPYPDKHFYGYETMSDKERALFDEWYVTVSGKVFDLKKELAMYGKNDVVLLREACMKYRDEFIQCTKLDPFRYTTLAACCMAVYKTHYLPKDTLALTHNNAYTNQNKTYSAVSIEWLEYVKTTRGVNIQHALNHGEMVIGKYHLDGYYEKDGVKYGFEFNGCMFHGHECRYNPNHLHPLSKVPYGLLRRQFDDKVEILEKAYGLDVEVMWECDWNNAKQNDVAVMAFMSTYIHPERLKPRNALFGGRTNAYKLYHKAHNSEKIRYVDFTSLYPFCQAKKCYPIGHPQIIFKDFEPLENYYGFVKATVLPPRKLLHPVLPYRTGGKLMFPLCRTCAEHQNQTDPCGHTDEERAISGCWVSIELLKGVEKGYIVTNVDEVWHFPQRSETLFCDYVKTFLQYKQEASGFPAHVMTDADKESYISDYFEKEGIKMDAGKISRNPARRSINKLLLNSLWGRFSMRENLPCTELISDPEQFTQHIFGDGYDVKHFSFVSDSVALIQWCYADGKGGQTRDINIFLGAFTTAHARLELYELMDKLGDRLLYSDTDSVIFTSREGDWEPPLGPYLGNLTDEVGAGDHIVEFCSGGPKTYGYRTAKGKVCMKAKGVTLNAVNSKAIRLDTLIGLVDHYVVGEDNSRHILAYTDTIVRNKKQFTLHNRSVVKKFKVVYNKRVLLPDFTTIPYGF
ncbi:uncharacterized protein LOC128608210 [Ictalurus furcatus]|uniref:uncharacterized protein LOC128608210 n=1 Tax=Ictalurus furcatus TaxID=66913 RepID=UPI00235051E8|nr:uncharacterized protein LOC128608210 [Ictalurus furcatus]XP_053481760.1 uncharacterized protein LOC128608210 [Ictalurus furcatus]XP_053481770.1 uncharacterized protein LOC128608210 [Ictalurus furcatus]